MKTPPLTTSEQFSKYLQTPLNRIGTGAEKYELRDKIFKQEDVLPMWVADMDLPVAPFIIDALNKRLQHPILGYTIALDSTYQAIVDWHYNKGLNIQADQIEFTHNVANGLFMSVHAFTEVGDTILVQSPVYPPFLHAPTITNRKCIESPLKLINNRYQMDFDLIERQFKENQIKLMLLCNPQNPSGRVWLEDELRALGELCLQYGVVIVSDEIHSSLTLKGPFISMASLSEEIANITVTLDSPGKTFNLGGLQIGYAIIQNPTLKTQLQKTKASYSIGGLNLFAITALQAAYSDNSSTVWVSSVKQLIKENIAYLKAFLNHNFPNVKVMEPEASYLIWLDFSAVFDSDNEMWDWLIKKAKLGLNRGQSFSKKETIGRCCVRMNLAIPKSVLAQACQQLLKAKVAIK